MIYKFLVNQFLKQFFSTCFLYPYLDMTNTLIVMLGWFRGQKFRVLFSLGGTMAVNTDNWIPVVFVFFNFHSRCSVARKLKWQQNNQTACFKQLQLWCAARFLLVITNFFLSRSSDSLFHQFLSLFRDFGITGLVSWSQRTANCNLTPRLSVARK